MKLLFVLLFFINQANALENKLLPFTTDGCSKVPDANLSTCCQKHDLDYWKGGTESERMISDENLEACVKEKVNPFLGSMFYWGVRLGGSPELSTSFRWGYGWIYKRNYSPLSKAELKQVKKLAPKDPTKVRMTEAKVRIKQRPTLFGNYCLDQIHESLKAEFKNQKAEIETNRDQYQTVVRIKLKEKNILFTYRNSKWKECQSPHFEMVLPRFYKAIYFE